MEKTMGYVEHDAFIKEVYNIPSSTKEENIGRDNQPNFFKPLSNPWTNHFDVKEVDVEFPDFEISNHISVNLDYSPSNNNSLVSSLQIKSGTPQAGGNNIPSTTIQAPATRSPDNSSGASGYGGANIRGEGEGESKTEKRPILKRQEELCLVCGDFASGYHYVALTCEGCKGFFRRSITKNAVYHCTFGNSCDIDMYMRRKCRKCRLEKCLYVGMRIEYVMPVNQLTVKKEVDSRMKKNGTTSGPLTKKITTTSDDHYHSNEKNSFNPYLDKYQHNKEEKTFTSVETLQMSPGDHIYHSPSQGLSLNSQISKVLLSTTKSLSPEQEKLINLLVHYDKKFKRPSEKNLRKISKHGLQHESESEAKFQYITEMTILTVLLIVEYSKSLPGFDTLLREDKITLLKACSSEVMMLRGARCYDTHTDSIMFADNLQYNRESYNLAGVGDTVEPLFKFGKAMSSMKVNNAEYALLTAIVVFTERPGLVESLKVEKIQEIFLETLQAYVIDHRPRPMIDLAKFLSILTELRTLGNLNSEMCNSFKSTNKRLPPFLAEIWDVNS